MKSTKEKILDNAHRCFNKDGVASVSIRQIAAKTGISHSNLIYHYKNMEALLEALHERMLKETLGIHAAINSEEIDFPDLRKITEQSFNVHYTYRFFMLDLSYIMRSFPTVHQRFLQIENIRAEMYRLLIRLFVRKSILRKEEFSNEYEHLITHIRTFHDFWLASAEIYDQKLSASEKIEKYTDHFMQLFVPYHL